MDENQKQQDLTAVAPSRVTDFVQQLANWRRNEITPGWWTMHEFYHAEGRMLGLAKRYLEALLAWTPVSKNTDELRGLISLVDKILKTAVVDGELVVFVLTGGDIIQLRSAVLHLDRYDLAKQADARDAGRGHYSKGRR
jgi:hypothetical protein